MTHTLHYITITITITILNETHFVILPNTIRETHDPAVSRGTFSNVNQQCVVRSPFRDNTFLILDKLCCVMPPFQRNNLQLQPILCNMRYVNSVCI